MRFKLIAGLIAVVVVLGGIVAIQQGRIKVLAREKEQAIDFNNASDRQIQWYKNKLGAATARVKLLELTPRNAEDLAEDKRLAPATQFKGVKKDLSNVEEVINIEARVDTVIKLVPYKPASIEGASLTSIYEHHFQDSLNIVDVMFGKDTSSIHLQMIVPINGAVFWQRRKNFLGLRMWPNKKEWTVDMVSTNPFVTLTGLDVIKIKKR